MRSSVTRSADAREAASVSITGRGRTVSSASGSPTLTTTASGRTSATRSTATVLLVLEELGDVDGPVVAMAFGPGLTLYATLLLPA